MNDTTAVEDQPPGPSYDPPPIAPRRLSRSRDDRMLAGVCGGLAAYLGVDPALVRIGMVLFSFAGIGVAAYVLAWLLVPEEGDATPTWRPPWQIAIAIVGVLLLSDIVDVFDGDGTLIPLTLLAIGAVLVWGGRDSAVAPVAAPVPRSSLPVTGAGAVVEHTGPGRWSWAPAPGSGSDTTAAMSIAGPAAPPAQRRSEIGRSIAVAFGGLLLAAGAVFGSIVLSDEVSPVTILGPTLIGFGVVMAMGSWWGWTRPLAFGAFAVLLSLCGLAVIDVPITGGIDDRLVAPATAADIPGEERLAIGELEIDLTGLTLTGGPHRLEASVALGELIVRVPEGVTVDVTADMGVGQMDLFDFSDEGPVAEVDRVFEGDLGAGRIELDLEVGIGHLELRRG